MIETVQECLQAILEGVEGDIDDLPKGASAVWYPTTTDARTTFRVGEFVPFDPYSRVVGIFHNDDVIRVYTLPAAAPTPRPQAWIDRAPMRYTLSRTAPTYAVDTMNLDAFAAETIKEWNALVDDEEGPNADDELLAVVEYIERRSSETGGMLALTKLVEELNEGAHRPDDEEEEEGDEEETAADPTQANPANPTQAAPAVSS
jgi:hypothetical protein